MKRTKIFISIALFFAIVLSCIPLSVFANEVAEPEITEAEPTNSELTLYDSYTEVTDDIIGAVNEVTELREENVKHFSLPNGTYEAVSYGQAVHRKDSDGVWQDINNDLTLTTVGTKEIYSTPDSRVSFDKESNALTLSENGYSIYMSLLSRDDGNMSMTTEPMNIEVVNGYENRPEYYDALEEAIEVNNRSSITYSNVMNGTDIEYVMNGNDIKENIIVKTKKDSYEYGFMLALHGLVPTLENNVIILKDETTNEEKYIIPAPYMYDSNDMYSYDVEYGLIHAGGEKYLLTVTADEEWINSDERAWPVTIDPTISQSRIVYDTYVDSSNASTNYGTASTALIAYNKIALIRITIPTLPDGATLTNAYLDLGYYFTESSGTAQIKTHKINSAWTETIVTHSSIPRITAARLSSATLTASTTNTASSPGIVSLEITSAVSTWLADATTNYGIAIQREGGTISTVYLPSYDSGYRNTKIRINYAHTIPDGVYALENGYTQSRWMTIASNGVWSGYNIQHEYSTTSPVDSFDRSSLFKISQKGNTGRYIIRSMLNNRIGIVVSGTRVYTQGISPKDEDVPDGHTYNITWNGNGFVLYHMGTRCVIKMASTSTADLTTGSYESEGNNLNASWELHKYTGSDQSDLAMYGTTSWSNNGIAIGVKGEPILVSWSTVINANVAALSIGNIPTNVAEASVRDSVFLTLTAKAPGTVNLGATISYANGTVLRTESFNYQIYPSEGTYYIQNAGLEEYICARGSDAFLTTTYVGLSNQKWIIEKSSTYGYVTLRNEATNTYLGVSDASVNLYSSINDYTKWKIETTPTGNIKFVCKSNEPSNYALASISTSSGADAEMVAYTDDQNASGGYNSANYTDEWYLVTRVITYVNYYDTSFASGKTETQIREQIKETVSFSNLVYSRYFGIGLYMSDDIYEYTTSIENGLDKCSALNSPCEAGTCGASTHEDHHKNVSTIADDLYNKRRLDDQIIVLWTDRDEDTYCVVDSTGNHECLTYDALVVGVTVGEGDDIVEIKRPVIHILYSYDRSLLKKDICRAILGLILAHETAHCFQMYEAYKKYADHDPNLSTSGAACDCIMKPVISTDTDGDGKAEAKELKEGIENGVNVPFCSRCTEDLKDFISNLTLPGNT